VAVVQENTPAFDGDQTPHTSEDARARVRARNRANTRMKWYGIAAIAVAGFALVALLFNVFVRAADVLNEHYIEMPLTIAEGENDFLTLQKKAMREAFPYVSGRKDKRKLYDLVSDGASDDMRADAAVGALETGDVTRQFLASDNVDYYLRGKFGRLRDHSVAGTVSAVDGGAQIEFLSTESDFAGALEIAKASLRQKITFIEREAALHSNALLRLGEVIPTLTGQELEEAENQIKTATAKRDNFLSQAASLEETINAPGSEALALNSTMASFFIRANGGILKLVEISDRRALAKPIVPMASFSEIAPSDWSLQVFHLPESRRKVSDLQIGLVEQLRSEGRISSKPNFRFFSTGDSTQPEIAGIKAALFGSILTLLITFFLAFPIAVLAAIYLEEFARKSWFTDFIEVNINNLAAVPSIVFGLLGLAILTFVVKYDLLQIVRGAPLIGGFVLALMTLPTIIIASRAAIRAVPPSIRTAALGLGASKVQTVFHHVLPLAMPGILTGTIIGMAQALGETAPLLLIGMVAFITASPDCFGATNCLTDQPATVLPVQVFQWANGSERAFDGRTAAAIVVLLIFLVVMNAIAVFLRKRFERRW